MKKQNQREERVFFPVFLMGGLFIFIHSLALLVIRPFEAAEMVAFENPSDPMNLVYFFTIFLSFTLAILLIAKFWKKQLIQGIVLVATGSTVFYLLYPLLLILIPEVWSFFISATAAVLLVLLLVKYPKWYVLDIFSIIVGVGAIAVLGISLSILLVIVLLVGLAAYDAISVYKTKHMIDLADTVLDLKLPVMLIIPRVRNYSLSEETKSLKEKIRENEKRDAFFMGLGDIIMPGILVVSSFYNIATNGILVAISVMLGTLLGFALLIVFVIKGKPQAGLPYLCSGAILGYLISSYILFGKLVGLA